MYNAPPYSEALFSMNLEVSTLTLIDEENKPQPY